MKITKWSYKHPVTLVESRKLKDIRRAMIRYGDMSKVLDAEKLKLSYLIRQHKETIDKLEVRLSKVKELESDSHDRYLDAYSVFRDGQEELYKGLNRI